MASKFKPPGVVTPAGGAGYKVSISKYPISADGKIHFLFNTSQQKRGLGKGADYPTHTELEFSKIYLREYFKFETMNMNI